MSASVRKRANKTARPDRQIEVSKKVPLRKLQKLNLSTPKDEDGNEFQTAHADQKLRNEK